MRRLAAIDIGSNSIHMVIADVAPDGGITVVERTKEMVRLGRGVFTTGSLSRQTMDLAVRALRTFARLATVRHVERLRAVATSAVREAANGRAFVERARRETGLPIRIISGREEARLIFRAATHSLGLAGGPHLLVDVGGGSVELGLVRDGRPLWLESLPLGVGRLTERFLASDPPTAKERKHLRAHLSRELGRLLSPTRRTPITAAVGTSGTIHTVVAMAQAARGEETQRIHGASATVSEIGDLCRQVLASDAAGRLLLPGMDSKRADLMPAALILIQTILDVAGVGELEACTWALREGILLDLAGVPLGGLKADPRSRSVEGLARRFAGDNAHGRQTAWLALALFDATATTLGLPHETRELLEYTALLHDIGRAIDHERHHHHSAYLIRNAELLGFTQEEITIIASVARGHRKQPPRRSDPDLRELPPRLRRAAPTLATLLRIADALDRTHFAVVKDLVCSRARGRFTIQVALDGENADLELWAAGRRLDALSRLLDRPVVLRTTRVTRRVAPKRQARASS
jgi:exopolyphosphatase/guanosine-5'-triphosphate,3'-diphosphate pyrophosphatase